MAVTTNDDYFGQSMIGYDPKAAGMDQLLSQLTQLQSLVQPYAAAQAPTGSQPWGSAGGPGAALPVAGSLRTGVGGVGGGINSGTQPGAGGGSSGGLTSSFNTPYSFNYNKLPKSGIPEDMQPVRTGISNMLTQNLDKPINPYQGDFGLPKEFLDALGGAGGGGIGGVGVNFRGGEEILAGLGGFNEETDISQLMPVLQQLLGGDLMPKTDLSRMQRFSDEGANTFASARGTAQDIAKTGGAPIQQLMAALQAMEGKSKVELDRQKVEQQAQYQKMGLGTGSDLGYAVANGQALGRAQLESQQQELMTQIMMAASQNQMSGVNALTSIGQGYGQLGGLELGGQQLNLDTQKAGIEGRLGTLNTGLDILRTPVQDRIASANIRLGTAGTLGQYAQTEAQAAAAGLSARTAALGMYLDNSQFNQKMNYAEFLRQEDLTPMQKAGLDWSTRNPAQQAQGSNTGAAAISAAGSIGAAIIPWLFMSDRDVKENVDVATPVLDALEALDISNWQYKGDNTRHIGPMAQDFQTAFGVGDGKTIALVDVCGVMLKAMQELTAEVRSLRGE
jgi:hypothetical protein